MKNDFQKLAIERTFEISNQENDRVKTILERNMNTTNLLSKLINSNKLETVKGLNQALECIGVDQDSQKMNQNQVNEIKSFIIQKFTDLADLKGLVESIKDSISVEEMELFKRDLSLKMDNAYSVTQAPVYGKRIETLKSCFEEVSGDSVL